MTMPALVQVEKREGGIVQITEDVVPTFALYVGGGTAVVWLLHEVVPQVLAKAAGFSDHVNGLTDAEMQVRGYDAQEASELRAAYADLAKLHRVATGQDALPSNADLLDAGRRLPIKGPR